MIDQYSPKEAEPATIILSDDISISTIGEAHAKFVQAFGIHNQVIGSVDAAASVDLSGVQLIESARRTALAAGGTFVLAVPAAGDLFETLRRGGFLATRDQRAFWLKNPEEQ